MFKLITSLFAFVLDHYDTIGVAAAGYVAKYTQDFSVAKVKAWLQAKRDAAVAKAKSFEGDVAKAAAQVAAVVQGQPKP